MRKASIKETGEELSPSEWARFDAAVARLKAERAAGRQGELALPRGVRRERAKSCEANR